VVLADYVTQESTGCVHTAPGHGPDDFETGKQYDLPPFCPVDEAGKYTDEVKTYAGRFTKEADQDIIKELDNFVVVAHLGSATITARAAMAEIAARNLVDFFEGQEPEFRVC